MALKGVRVLELAGLAPGPFCGMILADFGATVTKVDNVAGMNVECLGAGKESIQLNLKHERGKEVFRKLCVKSDVLIEPFRAGTMERLGLGPNEILSLNPRLIYARLTGFGQSGPLSKTAGHDINYVALSGVLSTLGRAGEPPTAPLNLLADFAGGGLTCALGVLLALVERASSGRGQVVDAAMTEGVAYLASWVCRSHGVLPLWGAERGRNALDSGAHFYDTYETRDGRFMAVGAIEPQFYAELLARMGLDEEVPQYGDWSAAKRVLARRFKERTQAEWSAEFQGSDACVVPVLTLEEAASHPHNVIRDVFRRVSRRGAEHGGEEVLVPQPAPKLSRTPGRSRAAAGDEAYLPGKDTRRILRELGYSDHEVERLVEEGAAAAADPSNSHTQSKL